MSPSAAEVLDLTFIAAPAADGQMSLRPATGEERLNALKGAGYVAVRRNPELVRALRGLACTVPCIDHEPCEVLRLAADLLDKGSDR